MSTEKPICEARVSTRGTRLGYHQCTKPVWKDGFCKVHHPDSVKLRDEKSRAKFKEQLEKSPYARLAKAQERIAELEAEIRRLKGEKP